ncbi:MAG: hypothetical protein OXI72_17350 [Gemmatimonadota bacterium]|nr:hypothetical protein [Gemmatimonadota bacterium]
MTSEHSFQGKFWQHIDPADLAATILASEHACEHIPIVVTGTKPPRQAIWRWGTYGLLEPLSMGVWYSSMYHAFKSWCQDHIPNSQPIPKTYLKRVCSQIRQQAPSCPNLRRFKHTGKTGRFFDEEDHKDDRAIQQFGGQFDPRYKAFRENQEAENRKRLHPRSWTDEYEEVHVDLAQAIPPSPRPQPKPASQRVYLNSGGLTPELEKVREACYARFEEHYPDLALIQSKNLSHIHHSNYGGPNRQKGSRRCVVCDALAEDTWLNDHHWEALWMPNQTKIPRFYGKIAVMHPYYPKALPQSELVCVRFLAPKDSWYAPGSSCTIFIGPPELMDRHLPRNNYMLDRQDFNPEHVSYLATH